MIKMERGQRFILPGTDVPVRVEYAEKDILGQAKRSASQISKICQGEELIACQILEGSRKFYEAVMGKTYELLPIGQIIEQSIQIGSYGKKTKSEFPPQILKWMDLDPEDLDGKVFLLVDTILDTGKTIEVALRYLLQWMSAANCRPKKILVVSLISKVGKNQKKIAALIREIQKNGIPVEVLSGWEVQDDKYYVGFGLDHQKKYRGLPFIGYVIPDEKEVTELSKAA